MKIFLWLFVSCSGQDQTDCVTCTQTFHMQETSQQSVPTYFPFHKILLKLLKNWRQQVHGCGCALPCVPRIIEASIYLQMVLVFLGTPTILFDAWVAWVVCVAWVSLLSCDELTKISGMQSVSLICSKVNTLDAMRMDQIKYESLLSIVAIADDETVPLFDSKLKKLLPQIDPDRLRCM